MPLQVVLDKSFLRSSCSESIARLCKEHNMLVTDTLLYEMVDNVEDRDQCFAKMPNEPDAVVFLPCIGSILKYEQEKLAPASPLIDHRLPGRLAFNKILRSKKYDFSGTDDALPRHRLRTQEEVEGLVGLAGSVDKLWPELRSDRQFPARIRADVAARPEIIRQLYRNINDDNALVPVIGPNWCIFRWLQVRAIYCIDLGIRFMYDFSDANRVKIEHHLHDMNYVVYAALTGAIATADKGVSEIFRLVRPDGIVIDQP